MYTRYVKAYYLVSPRQTAIYVMCPTDHDIWTASLSSELQQSQNFYCHCTCTRACKSSIVANKMQYLQKNVGQWLDNTNSIVLPVRRQFLYLSFKLKMMGLSLARSTARLKTFFSKFTKTTLSYRLSLFSTSSDPIIRSQMYNKVS